MKPTHDVKISPEALQQKKFYRVQRVFPTTPTTLNPKPIRFVYKFDLKKMKELKLQTHLQFNLEIFRKCEELIPGHNLHYIISQKDAENGVKMVFVNPYQGRLDGYVKGNGVGEAESVEIMREVVEAIYCLCKQDYICSNIRAENFVRVQMPSRNGNLGEGKAFRWKLQSVPFTKNYQANALEIDSPYTFKKQYNAPTGSPTSSRPTESQAIKQTIVWNIGCIWLEILYGRHILDDDEKIRKFCIGNGRTGVFNLDTLGLAPKLSPQNFSLLTKLLNFQPKKRLSLTQLFINPLFGELINIFIQKRRYSYSLESSKVISQPYNYEISMGMGDSLTKPPQYLTMTQFIGELVRVIERDGLLVLREEKSAIKKVCKALASEKGRSVELSNYSPKKFKNTTNLTEQVIGLTVQNLEHYLRPYKFYLDKTIFLSRCSTLITQTLHHRLQTLPSSHILDPNRRSDQAPYDLTFNFRHAMLYMRLIYLQNLLRNLELYQNVFALPGGGYEIGNLEYQGTSEEWGVFCETAVYEALKIYTGAKFKECQQQFQILVSSQSSSQTHKISSTCHQKIHTIYQTIKYQTCPVHQFYPHYQQTLIKVMTEIDSTCLRKKDYKMQSNLLEAGVMRKEIQRVAMLEIAIFLESRVMWKGEVREGVFLGWMRDGRDGRDGKEGKEPSFYKINQPIINSRDTVLKSEDPELDKQVFSFKAYENFLKHGNFEKVTQQVTNLLAMFTF